MKEVMHMLDAFEFRNEFWCLFLPVILMGFDILTGFINAWSKKEIQSKKLRTGLSKKIGEISILVIGEFISFALRIPPALMKGISIYIMIMEGISILENCVKLGIPVPEFIKKVLNNVSDTFNSADAKELIKVIETDKEVTSDDSTGNNRESN